MTIKECYEAFGGAYDEVLARMAGMERMVIKFAQKYLNDATCGQLNDALAKNDYEEAFRAAHTLKGVALNLGFTRLAQVSSELTEVLRPGHEARRTPAEITPLLTQVNTEQTKITTAIKELT